MFNSMDKKSPTTKKLAYFSIGGEEGDETIPNYVGILKEACLAISASQNIVSKVEIIEDESHVSVVTPSIWRAIKFFDTQKQ